jgi:F-type H+-transporting ATPase subunit a
MITGKGLRLTFLFFGLFFLVSMLTASEPEQQEQHSTPAEHHNEDNEPFDPSSFMFGHISDGYDWHLFDIGHKSISIPLPVIVYSREKGLNVLCHQNSTMVMLLTKDFILHMPEKLLKKLTKKEKPANPMWKEKIVETLNSGELAVPIDISVTKNIAALFFSVLLILFMFLSVAKAYKRNPNKAPKGLQSWLEPVILFVRDEIAIPSIGKKNYHKFLPYLLTVFFFIWINNLLGLIPIPPGGANVTGNIAVTMVLAFFTFLITTIRGTKSYWQHIFNTPGVPLWLKLPIPLMPLVEVIGVFAKPIVLMVRLFANITAGHIIAMGFLSLIFIFAEINPYLGGGVSIVSIAFIIFMTFLELLVAFIQAYVFTFLSAIYFGMAVEEHH